MGCANVPAAGALGEGTVAAPKLTSADTTRPPRFAWIELTQPAYVALVLVAPGHSATLLYPRDTATDNHLAAGTHQLTFEVPRSLAQSDSERVRALRQRLDSVSRGSARGGSVRGSGPGPISATTPTYLLLITSPQPLVYRRILEKTAGVSIPTVEMEALNAVGKAVRSTITEEPRDWAGAYTRVVVRRP
jgi:hypothetical protein